MRVIFSFFAIFLIIALASSDALAESGGSYGWTREVGSRYWYSEGSIVYDVAKPRISRLEYTKAKAGTGEVFGTFINNRNGLTLRAMAGVGYNTSGELRDRDFIQDQDTSDDVFGGGVDVDDVQNFSWSDTSSDIGDSQIRYAFFDAGAPIWQSNNDNLTVVGFAGFGYIRDRMTARGLTCNATDSDDLLGFSGGLCPGFAGDIAVPYTEKVIANDAEWYLGRIGVAPRLYIGRGVRLEGEMAATYGRFKDHDSHYLRSETLGPTPNFEDKGWGYGGQAQMMLTYSPIDALTLGVGGRYWLLYANETDTEAGGEPSGTSHGWLYKRAGALAEARYNF